MSYPYPPETWATIGPGGHENTLGGDCVFHGFLPPNPWEGCHSIHGKPATQSTGNLPLSPRQGCHPLQAKPATVGAQRRWVAYY